MILADVTWDNIVMMGSAMGVLTGIQVFREKRKNGNGFNKDLCDERHKNINVKHDEINKHLRSVSEKLDRLVEHFL